MSTTYDQSLKEFDKTVEEMKKHDGFKNTRDGMFNRYYTLSFSKTATAAELNEYVEMLNIHTQLLKNLILLENALTNPDNNPELLSVVIESTDPKVKKMAAEFVPTLLEMKIEVERVLANSQESIKNRTSEHNNCIYRRITNSATVTLAKIFAGQALYPTVKHFDETLW
ncbi:MAG: hypothetical protein V4501_11825 [Pseudomonadota bacterium]